MSARRPDCGALQRCGFSVDPNAYEALVRHREAKIADDARIPGAGFKHASGTAAFGVLPD